MRWLQDPIKGDLELKLTHNDRDKGGHEAQDLEASRNFRLFPILPKVPLFFPYDKEVYMRTALRPKTICGGTASL